VIEDGIVHREFALTGEALHHSLFLRITAVQGEIQVCLMWCEVADESVVVMKFRPEKAGNSLEEKTGMTCCIVSRG
jgi:hypothetical protein